MNSYKIEVDCANCANKMEEAVNKLDGVNSCVVNFMTQKMVVDFKDGVDERKMIKEIQKTCKRIDSDFEIE